METLYQNQGKISRVKKYFTPYMELLTKPSGKKLFMLLLAVKSMQTLMSLRHLYERFLAPLGKISQNAYYYLLSYTKLPLEKFAAVTIEKALALIDEKHMKLPVLLLLDDTLCAKFGTKFECYATMFDHTQRNGSSYLKGHCFVALTICVPVAVGDGVKYLNIPVRFRMRGADESKLAIASEMITEAMKSLADIPTVVLLCDSWYPKGEVLKTVESHKNLELIANIRIDTALYALPTQTGKRGRPAKKGAKLSLFDFAFMSAGKYFCADKMVMTNLFTNPVYVTVTTPNLDNHGAYRLFISTISAVQINSMFRGFENLLIGDKNREMWLSPLYLYSFRWNIEVMFYELKTFWAFGRYMLRSKIGIENFINIIALSYTCAKIIPFADSHFSALAHYSTQVSRYAIGDSIRKELFLHDFVANFQNTFISDSFDDFDFLDFFA
jgi:hypothetical protein